MLAIKRLLDIVFSLLGIIFLGPVLLFVSVLVRLTVPGSVLFTQLRVGRRKEVFRILKFRTMAENGPHAGEVVGVGGFLRRTKLDELPQMLNILIGDMSFVGPRPYIVEESEGLPAERFRMAPGLTGLAQVNGNTCLAWEERTAYDIEYVRNWSLGLDFLILLKTVRVVLCGEEKCMRHKG